MFIKTVQKCLDSSGQRYQYPDPSSRTDKTNKQTSKQKLL